MLIGHIISLRNAAKRGLVVLMIIIYINSENHKNRKVKLVKWRRLGEIFASSLNADYIYRCARSIVKFLLIRS